MRHKTLDSLNDGDLAKLIMLFYELIWSLPKPDRIFVTGSDPLSLAFFARLKQSGYHIFYVACGQEDGFAQAVAQGIDLADHFDASCALTSELAQNCQAYFQQPVPVLGWPVRSSYLESQ